MLRLAFLSCVAIGLSLGDDSVPEPVTTSVPEVMPVVTLNLGHLMDPDYINEGDSVYFECNVKGSPKPYDTAWFHNGQELHRNLTSGVIMSAHLLALQGVTRLTAGNYTCLAVNTEGNITSNQVDLKVVYEPTCKGEKEQWYVAQKNETVHVKCEVDAVPPVVTFQWTFTNSGEQTVIPSTRYISRGTVSHLNHTPVSDMDFGTLYCRGANSVGPGRTPCVYHIVANDTEIDNTTLYLQNVPETSHISDLLSSGNRFEGGVYGDTDGKYYLFHFELNWIQAMELCIQFGKRAATFNSEAEYLQLTDLMRKKNGHDLKASYWTAGSDLGKTGKYVWHSTRRPFTYTRWDNGEPNVINKGNEVEHCIELQAENGYRMNDGLCSKKNYVICESNNEH